MKALFIVLTALIIQPVFASSPNQIADKPSFPVHRVKMPDIATQKLAKPVPMPKPSIVKPKPAKRATAPVARSKYTGSLGQWLYTLRMCESGGNYKINTGNGYYGAYQFSAATWNHWKTGYARADLAPPSVQDATVIKNTKASSGGLATQHPGCYKKHGLSQFPPS